jgi:hypothetical protein
VLKKTLKDGILDNLNFFCTAKPCWMERLLVFLFSITLLIATSPPPATGEGCDFYGGICMVVESIGGITSCSSSSEEDPNDCSKNSDCSGPICCLYGPCSCLCLMPEYPVLVVSPDFPEERSVKPGEHQDFVPQQYCLSIWKPPAQPV